MPRDPAKYAEPESEIDYAAEREYRILRIADANLYYQAMNVTLDGGIASKIVVFYAHHVLHHGMRALVSALGRRYPHTDDLTEFVDSIREYDEDRDWKFDSDMAQLTWYGSDARYGKETNPVKEFTRMANAVTDDLTRIYRRLAELTGEDPWSVPPDEDSPPISPRRRAG